MVNGFFQSDHSRHFTTIITFTIHTHSCTDVSLHDANLLIRSRSSVSCSRTLRHAVRDSNQLPPPVAGQPDHKDPASLFCVCVMSVWWFLNTLSLQLIYSSLVSGLKLQTMLPHCWGVQFSMHNSNARLDLQNKTCRQIVHIVWHWTFRPSKGCSLVRYRDKTNPPPAPVS